MFDDDDEVWDEYSEFEYFESSLSESMKFVAWTALLTLLAVGFVLAIAF